MRPRTRMSTLIMLSNWKTALSYLDWRAPSLRREVDLAALLHSRLGTCAAIPLNNERFTSLDGRLVDPRIRLRQLENQCSIIQ